MHKHQPKSAGVRSDEPHASMTRRAWLGVAANGAALAIVGTVIGCGGDRTDAAAQTSVAAGSGAEPQRQLASITVHKSPTCGCCKKWVEYMQGQGYTVTAHDMNDVTSIKREHGVPESLYSCHTAIADGYVFEGHVPADLVAKVLEERPAIAGLSAPGMPQSAPGMDIGNEPYDIKSFTKDGQIAQYARR